MRSHLLVSILGLLLLVGCASTQPTSEEAVCDCQREIRVPDEAFRSWLVNNGYAEKKRGKKLKATAKGCTLTSLECYNKGIHSLEGIGLFPQLEQVTCSDNPISKLDLSVLHNLQKLYCINVPLETLNLSQCHQLTHIQLSYTHLDHLDLTPHPELKELFCIFSPIDFFDLSPCGKLNLIYLRGTQIHELDIRPCNALWQLHALDTPLQCLIISPEQYDSNIEASIEDTVKIIVR
jgi:hypothetical protein